MHIRFIALLVLALSAGCVKKEVAQVPEIKNNTITSPCNGKTFCFTKDNEPYSFNATWTEKPATITTPGYIRISGEEDGGRLMVELNIYGASPGHYGITDVMPVQANDAALIYLDGAFGLRAYAGMVTITDINRQDMTIAGNFYATAQKGDTLYKFAEGNFADVPMK